MDRITVVNYCLGLLALLLLQGVLHVEGRGIFDPGNNVFIPKEDSDPQNKILALLLHKTLIPVEKEDDLDTELANTFAQLEQVRALKDDLELEKKLTVNNTGRKYGKRNRPECFWKYCV